MLGMVFDELPHVQNAPPPLLTTNIFQFRVHFVQKGKLFYDIQHLSLKESDPPTLHCAPVVVYERRGPQKLSFYDNASFKNSDRSKITN